MKTLVLLVLIIFSVENGYSNTSLQDTSIISILSKEVVIDTTFFSGYIITVQSKLDWKTSDGFDYPYEVFFLESRTKFKRLKYKDLIRMEYNRDSCLYSLCQGHVLSTTNFLLGLNNKNHIPQVNYKIDFLDDNNIYKIDKKAVYRVFKIGNRKCLRLYFSKPQLMQMIRLNRYNFTLESIPVIFPLGTED